MSHIARELKMLFYLNDHMNRLVKISELSDLLEVTPRQVRRYRDDLEQCEFYISEVRGPNGGYKLVKALDKSLMIPDNIMLALNVSAKNNVSLFKALNNLPVITTIDNVVGGDNIITDYEMNNLVLLVNAINESKSISFHYLARSGKDFDLEINPYKLSYKNHTYYLYGDHKGLYKCYDVDCISNLSVNETFEKKQDLLNIANDESSYGVKNDGKETTLILEYSNDSILGRIERVFEYKGIVDKDNKTYTIKSNSENELYYPLFQLGTKNIKINNKEFKTKYIRYLENQLKALNQ